MVRPLPRTPKARTAPRSLRCHNNATHQAAVAVVAKRLRARGHGVAIRDPRHMRGDLLVDGCVTISVHCARPTRRQHVVTVHGKRYRYFYSQIQWNTHARGKPLRRPPDVFCFSRTDTAEVLLVPRRAHRRLSLSLQADVAVRDRTSRYYDYLNQWRIIADAVAAKRKVA